MEIEIAIRIVLVAPPAGVDFGVQRGKGNAYATILTQRSTGADLNFEFTLTVKDNRDDKLPNLLGPFAQGPAAGRFVYIDVGQAAGQADSPWRRRIKVPLGGLDWDSIRKVNVDSSRILEARLPGTGKDGGPNCATIQPVGGWNCRRR